VDNFGKHVICRRTNKRHVAYTYMKRLPKHARLFFFCQDSRGPHQSLHASRAKRPPPHAGCATAQRPNPSQRTVAQTARLARTFPRC